jgi:hypothetical protein
VRNARIEVCSIERRPATRFGHPPENIDRVHPGRRLLEGFDDRLWSAFMQEGSRWLIKVAFRCGEGGSSLGVVGGAVGRLGGSH